MNKGRFYKFIHTGNQALKYVLILALFLLLLLICCEHFKEKKPEMLPLRVHVVQGDFEKDLVPFSEEGDTWYFFVPGNADADKSYVYAAEEVSLEGNTLSQEAMGLTISELEYDREYAVFEDKASSNLRKVVFKEMSALPVMYIDTALGNMANVYHDKNHKEPVKISLLDASGKLDYEGKGKDKINGRGNTTWEISKKPFKLTLDRSSKLLGMNPAPNWVLLANGYDISNLRNKLVLDAARDAGAFFSPACEFVDLYINGEYNGLYLLTEKPEIAENRVESGDLNQDFLFEIMQEFKISKKDLLSSSASGRSLRIDYPKTASKGKIDEITEKINELEHDIKNGDYTKIDMRSWVLRVLTDEIFLNVDMDQASSHYFYDTLQDRFFAGPVWDYDICLGNGAIRWGKEYSDPEVTKLLNRKWYYHLYQNDIFRNEMKKVYKDVYRSILMDISDRKISKETKRIEKSSEVNYIRWKKTLTEDGVYIETLPSEREKLSSFIRRRIDYLDRIWLEGQEEVYAEPSYDKEKEMTELEKIWDKLINSEEYFIFAVIMLLFVISFGLVGRSDFRKWGLKRRDKDE